MCSVRNTRRFHFFGSTPPPFCAEFSTRCPVSFLTRLALLPPLRRDLFDLPLCQHLWWIVREPTFHRPAVSEETSSTNFSPLTVIEIREKTTTSDVIDASHWHPFVEQEEQQQEQLGSAEASTTALNESDIDGGSYGPACCPDLKKKPTSLIVMIYGHYLRVAPVFHPDLRLKAMYVVSIKSKGVEGKIIKMRD
ncbi:hypothetical protein OUZ56_006777 [Daphnia magna]|uniref:Uncharacterized protein n=1 Tax=Daphnia magna TaxID=35525 RepID=A0ABQ9YWM4_9CRUS|nr:hypothetical protein OUZ56_006777 [Daphnia magna]